MTMITRNDPAAHIIRVSGPSVAFVLGSSHVDGNVYNGNTNERTTTDNPERRHAHIDFGPICVAVMANPCTGLVNNKGNRVI